MSLTDNNRQLYICVDFLLPRISPNISAKMRNLNYDTLTEYIYYLETMRDLSPEWLIIPGHDWPYFGGNLRAEQLLAHHDYRLNILIDAIGSAPISTNDAMMLLFPFEMNKHEIFFASCEARAHLNRLVNQGHLQSIMSRDGVDMFFKC